MTSLRALALVLLACALGPAAAQAAERPPRCQADVPSAIVIGQLEVASNFYNVFRDSIVMAEATVVLGIGAWLIFAIQKRFPGGLAEGERLAFITGASTCSPTCPSGQAGAYCRSL